MKRQLGLTAMFILALCAMAQASSSEKMPLEVQKAAIDRIYKEQSEKHKDNKDMLVLPGLLADRAAKRVMFYAQATSVEKGSPVEFFVTSDTSARDYESVTVSLARPSDIRKALMFIGMEPGYPVSAGSLRFWPKGERVIATFVPDGVKDAKPLRLERTILDDRTKKPLPETGLVFVGSVMVAAKRGSSEKVLSADIDDRGSVAANYNEPFTILDVPRKVPQQEVYNRLSVNTDARLPTNSLVQVVIEPEYKDGRKRVMDLSLVIGQKVDKSGTEFRIVDAAGKELNKEPELNKVLEIITSLVGKGTDPFVTVKFDEKLTLKTVNELVTKVLSPADTENGMRIEPPPAGHLYYRAFMPPESFRDRASRMAQPWELRLSLKDSKVSGTLTWLDEIWTDGQPDPEVKPTHFNVPTPKDLRRELDEAAKREKAKEEKDPDAFVSRPPVILVFADPGVTYGQFMEFISVAMPTHPLVHVFVEADEKK